MKAKRKLQRRFGTVRRLADYAICKKDMRFGGERRLFDRRKIKESFSK